MAKQPSKTPTSGGRVDLRRLRRVTERELRATSPPELADLPAGFWDDAGVVQPVGKLAISVRIDEDVLAWFRAQGPRYQSRMNAVLRSFMTEHQRKAKGKTASR